MSAADDRVRMGDEVQLLGPVRVPTPGGDTAAAPGPLPTRLLVALTLAGPTGMRTDALIEAIWPDEPPRRPRAALQMLVSRVRAIAASGVLVSTATGYALTATDLWGAEGAVIPDDAAAAVRVTTMAIEQWRGTPGDDVDEPELASALATRGADAAHRLRAARAAALLAAGRPDAALDDLTVLTTELPLAADLLRLRMTALAAVGRTGDAIGAFAAYRERLGDALGIDPDADLVALHARLLRVIAAPTGGTATGLRAATTPLLGRDADVARLTDLVDTNRLTTIAGIGGLGKTRLAQEVGARSVGGFDAVVFVELAGARRGEDVPLVIGAAVGARAAQGRRLGDTTPLPDLASRIRESLGGGRTLLILDNCEQVVDVVARWVVDLLAAVPTLAVLTTSRVPLAIAGERIHPLAPLPADTDGTRLFLDRSRAVRPGTRLDAAQVARVVERLDGLPLAIELAAARLRAMSLDELDRRLHDRFAVLVGSDRTAPERHRTLFAVIDWSWQLLSPVDRDALAALAVFPDGFAAESASGLLDRDAADTLGTLVGHSLLTFSEPDAGAGRYRMLETVREFGVRALEDRGGADAAQRALDEVAVQFSRRIAPGLLAGIDPTANRAVAVEEETLLAVLRRDPGGRERVVVAVFAVLAESWIYRGDFEAVATAIPMLLAAAPRHATAGEDQDDLLRALTIAGAFAWIAGASGRRALVLLRRTVAELPADTPGFWPAIARALAETESRSGSGSGSATMLGFARLTTAADPMIATFASMLQAQFDENAGNTAAALTTLRRAVVLAERHGYTWFRIFALGSIAQLHSQRAERAEALRVGRAAWTEIAGVGLGTDLQQLEWMIAANEVAVGELAAAEARFARLGARRVPAFDADDVHAIALAGLAEVATARHDPDVAERWSAATRAARRASPPWRVIVTASALAVAAQATPVGAALPSTTVADARRLRAMLLALGRLGGRRLDAPVFATGLLGVSAVLRVAADGEQRAKALELAALAAVLGARLDLPSLEAVAVAARASGATTDASDRPAAIARSFALLRAPVTRL